MASPKQLEHTNHLRICIDIREKGTEARQEKKIGRKISQENTKTF